MSYQFRQGSVPLLLSIPHNGSHISDEIGASMTAEGRTSRDTDWFVDRLYNFSELNDASVLVAEHSRYVIDLNRPVDNQSLYPGQTTTGLIPQQRFDGMPIYKSPPNEDEIQHRIDNIWKPYHHQIDSELKRMVNQFGIAVLVEAHSIEPILPRLFEGRLPDFNLGTNKGNSCDQSLADAVTNVLAAQSQYSHVLNGRFLGGYITRHFGSPADGCHAIQFELSQATYMDYESKTWDESKAAQIQTLLKNIIVGIKSWLRSQQS